jgi:hypothetical protein
MNMDAPETTFKATHNAILRRGTDSNNGSFYDPDEEDASQDFLNTIEVRALQRQVLQSDSRSAI